MRLYDLGERDGWTCWICGNAVDPNAVPGSHQAASMDHVVPRSAGGETVDDNLRLAHRKCNSKRSNLVPELSWPTHLHLIQPAPLWQSVRRLSKRKGTRELVAMLPDREEAEDASRWVVMAATMMSGEPWTSEVQQFDHGWAVQLSNSA